MPISRAVVLVVAPAFCKGFGSIGPKDDEDFSSLTPAIPSLESRGWIPPFKPTHVYYGRDYCSPWNPCYSCQGDCDEDSDCQRGLKCWKRKDGSSGAPGCGGQPQSEVDYCYDPGGNPTPSPTQYPTACDDISRANQYAYNECQKNQYQPPLVFKGNDAGPIFGQPRLGVCEGDCDTDQDCDWGFVCFSREGNEPVPGCDNSNDPGGYGTDYCVANQ